jgi:PAS domain-containing protein
LKDYAFFAEIVLNDTELSSKYNQRALDIEYQNQQKQSHGVGGQQDELDASAVVTINELGIVTQVNPNFCRVFGYSSAEASTFKNGQVNFLGFKQKHQLHRPATYQPCT